MAMEVEGVDGREGRGGGSRFREAILGKKETKKKKKYQKKKN